MKTLIGLVIVLCAVLGIIWLMQRDDSVLMKFFKNNKKETNDVVVEETSDTDNENGMSDSEVDSNVFICSSELLTQDCDTVDKVPVCSTDTLISADGSRETNQVDYISACHYCKFFGADGVQEFGEDKVESSGYVVGSCTQ